MSLPTIPSGISVSYAGYGFSGPSGARRTDIMAGRGRYGLNYYGSTSQFSVTLIVTPDQFHVWTLFYHRKIGLGTLPFLMKLDSGLGLRDHECNIFPDSYQVAWSKNMRIVSFNVEAKASAYDVDQCVVQVELDYWDCTEESLCPALGRLSIFANEDVLILNNVN